MTLEIEIKIQYRFSCIQCITVKKHNLTGIIVISCGEVLHCGMYPAIRARSYYRVNSLCKHVIGSPLQSSCVKYESIHWDLVASVSGVVFVQVMTCMCELKLTCILTIVKQGVCLQYVIHTTRLLSSHFPQGSERFANRFDFSKSILLYESAIFWFQLQWCCSESHIEISQRWPR